MTKKYRNLFYNPIFMLNNTIANTCTVQRQHSIESRNDNQIHSTLKMHNICRKFNWRLGQLSLPHVTNY